MKNVGRRLLMSVVSLSMVIANVMGSINYIYAADSQNASIYIDTDQVITQDFEGFGVQWDPSDLFDYTDEQWDSFYEKAEFLKPNIMRVMLHDGDSYVVGFDDKNNPIYDWDSVMMKRVYKILDFAEKNDVPIILGEWRSISERGLLSYTETGKTVKWDNPIWQRMIMDCLEHLIVEKGYTCIKYYNMVNEPNYYVRDNKDTTDQESYDMWKKGITQLREMMDASEYEAIRNIKIVGPDVYDKQEAWIQQAKGEDLKDIIELTEVHRYAPKSEVESGLIETKLRNWKAVAEELDPQVSKEGFALGEMGISGTGPGDSNLNTRKYDYGVDMFDYALQATRAGLKFGSVWGFEDSMHVQHNDIINNFKDRYGPQAQTEEGRAYQVHTPTGDPSIDNDIKIWGFWNELGEEMAAQNAEAGVTGRANTVQASDENLKPWYYTWSMFCRYMPAGMSIVETTDSGVDQVRATSGMIPRGNNQADLSIAVVNTTNKEQKVTLNVPNADGPTTLNQYFYFDGDRPMNEKGQLEVYDTLKDVDLSKGLEITMPANTCMIFTTLGYNQESHPMTLTTGQTPDVQAVDIYEESQAVKITVGETYQMKTSFTPSISQAEMAWKVTDYFGNDSNIADIDEKGQLVANKAGQFKVVGYVKDHPEIFDTVEMTATTTKSFTDDLMNLDVGTYENITRDDKPSNFNNAKTIKRSDSNANGKSGIITYQADGIFDFELKAYSLNIKLPTSGNFTVEASSDGSNWETIECEFAQQSQLSSNWYPFIVTPKLMDITKDYQYLRVVLKSQGYSTYDPQYGGGTVYFGEQTASEIEVNNDDEFVAIGDSVQLTADVLPVNVSQDVTFRVVETNGQPTTKATIDENGVLTGKEIGEVIVVIETKDQSLATYYPIQVVGGYFVDEIKNFDLMYDYGSFTYENNESKFGKAPLIKRNDDTPQSIVYAYNGIQEVRFETFSNATFTDKQASIYMSEDGIHYDLIDATITRIATAPGSSDFVKYRVSASVDTDRYNFVKFEVKNDEKIYNPMIAKAEIIYNEPSNQTEHINVVDNRITTNVGDTAQIDVRFAPLDSSAQLTYESVNPAIATVDENGVVTGVKIGSTYIKVILNEKEVIEVPVNILEQNIALHKDATATSEYNQTDKMAELAVDGDYSTRWGSKYRSTSESLIIDLGEEQTFDTVKIFWEAARATDYNIEVAGEDQNFTVVKEMRNITGSTNDVIRFDARKARYVKMNGIKPAGTYGYSIYELEVYDNSEIKNVDSIHFESAEQELYVGQIQDLMIQVNPNEATYPIPVYSSSDENIVKVVNGKMIAVKAGTATITAEADGQLAILNVHVVDENKFKVADELENLIVKDGQVQFSESDLYIFSIETSSNEKIIDLDGQVHLPILDTNVQIVVKVEDKDATGEEFALSRSINIAVVGDNHSYVLLTDRINELKSLDHSLYKPSTYAKVEETLIQAEELISQDNLLVSEVTDALLKMNDSVLSLELKEDRTVLDQQLTMLKQLNKDLYTKESYQTMLKLITDIEEMINDDSSQEEIEKAIQQLNQVYTLLIKQSDYDLLQNKVKELENADLSFYTKKSLENFSAVLITAKDYLTRQDMTTEGLYKHYTALLEAYHQLELKGDKTVIETLINKIESENLLGYTSESVDALKKVIAEVKEQLKDDLTENDCIVLMQKLLSAYDALEKIQDAINVKPSVTPTEQGNQTNQAVDNVQTSDPLVLGVYVIAGFIALMGLLGLKKKKQ